MKKVTVVLFAVASVVWACNNESKDSVETADSTNQANMDSSGSKRTVVTDEASSSFLVNAANGGMTEVKLGQMASEKGVNQRVKDFGAYMVHDHSAANDEVKTLAAQRNVTLPDSVSEENQKLINELSTKTGRAFDKAYIDAMIKDHKSDIDEFQEAGNKVNDADVKTFIDNTLPKLRAHLDSASAVKKVLK